MPGDEMGKVAVRDLDAFGLAGRARGVDHIGEMVGAVGFAHRPDGELRERVAMRIERHRQPRRAGETIDRGRRADDGKRLRVVEQIAQPCLRPGRVERQQRAAGAPHAKTGDDALEAAIERDADHGLGTDADRAEIARNRIGTPIELAIGHRPARAGAQGNCMRCRARAFRDALRHAPIGLIARLAPIRLDAFCVATLLLLPHHDGESQRLIRFPLPLGFLSLNANGF